MSLLAGSAAWSANPTNGDWNIAANWVPSTVPNGPGDLATFGPSSVTNLGISATVEIASIAFNADAKPYSLTTAVGTVLTISGPGIINDSQSVQNFGLEVTDATTSGFLFINSATAGELTVFNNPGGELLFLGNSNAGKASFTITGVGVRQGHLSFSNNANAAEATIAVIGDATATFGDSTTAANAVFTTRDGGIVGFSTSSSAEQANLQCSGGTEPGRGGGGVNFDGSATAAQSHIVVNGAAVAGAVGNGVIMADNATGGSATFVVNGGAEAGAEGATMNLYEESTGESANITLNPGINGGEAGSLFFFDHSDGGTASIALLGDSKMDIGNRAKPGVTIGSLEGEGPVFLGPKALVIGSNNRSTTFAGMIRDGGINQGTGGTLSKIGTGTLKLSGANTYTGQTTLSAGALAVRNTTGSATGTGPVQVDGGTLAGSGSIAGAVTIGSGGGPGAILSPGQGASKPTTLTLQSSLIFKADATYRYRLNLKKAKSDQVVANGVTIESGAQFNFQPVGRGRVRPGKVATVLNNTATTPIAGAFANLPEGSTLTAGSNILQVSYHGGDGNDLTLTVVP